MMMSMLQSNPEMALANHALASDDSREVIPSRFGEIAVDTRNTLFFHKGLLGMPQRQHFALANFPAPTMRQFKLLQSLETASLSFIALPLAMENALLRSEDIRNAMRDLAIREQDLILLLIVCVHREGAQTRLSVNTRAPVVIDGLNKTGMQYVFPHDHYKVQQYIT